MHAGGRSAGALKKFLCGIAVPDRGRLERDLVLTVPAALRVHRLVSGKHRPAAERGGRELGSQSRRLNDLKDQDLRCAGYPSGTWAAVPAPAARADVLRHHCRGKSSFSSSLLGWLLAFTLESWHPLQTALGVAPCVEPSPLFLFSAAVFCRLPRLVCVQPTVVVPSARPASEEAAGWFSWERCLCPSLNT